MATKELSRCWSAGLLLVSLAFDAAGARGTLTPENVVVTRAMAEKGDAEAQCEMGLRCYEGKGVGRDMAEACKWLTLSSGQGQKRAVHLLEEVKLFATAEEIAEGQRRAGAERGPTNRLTVALLDWENKTGDATAAHWREAGDCLLLSQLGQVRGLRIVGGVGYGLRQIKKEAGEPLKAAEVRKLGELIEARRVIWGSYQREGERWAVTVRVLNVATGKASKDLQASSTNWYEIRDRLSAQMLKELEVTPTAAERRRMSWRATTSSVALESLMKTQFAYRRAPLEEVEQYGRQAVTADPRCALARAMLAAVLGSQGKIDEAEKEARKALRMKPDASWAHRTLGAILVPKNKFVDAEKELRIAGKLDPDDPEPLKRLGQMYSLQERLDEAIVQFRKALQLNPFDGSIHAVLGRTFALQRHREDALAALKEAERLAGANDVDAEQMLALAYSELRELPSAVEHLERFVTLGQREGLHPEGVKWFEARWQEMKARLAPVYVNAAPPRDYPAAKLAEALREKLTQGELGLVTNPLACTPEMNQWAQELTKGATNDQHKARMLFDALALRLNKEKGWGGSLTAQGVFAAWSDPKASFLCREHALLYVALARAVGLKAYFAEVRQDTAGENIFHACACVCFGDKALLADPAYFWFGAPHKKFTLLDDLHTVSFFLSQRHDLRSKRIAVKICPDSPLAQYNLAAQLMTEDRDEEARQMLPTLLRLEPDGYMANLCKGRLAMLEVEFEEAIRLLKKARDLNRTECAPHLLLSHIYTRQGRLREARDELRQALRRRINEEDAEEARRTLAKLNEQLGRE